MTLSCSVVFVPRLAEEYMLPDKNLYPVLRDTFVYLIGNNIRKLVLRKNTNFFGTILRI